MSTYCYSNDDGVVLERDFPMGQAPATVTLEDGTEARRDFMAENAPRHAGGSCWPMEPCISSGVNACQAQELRDFLGQRGCPTEVTPDGDPIYRDANHRKRALKLRNFCDNAGYY